MPDIYKITLFTPILFQICTQKSEKVLAKLDGVALLVADPTHQAKFTHLGFTTLSQITFGINHAIFLSVRILDILRIGKFCKTILHVLNVKKSLCLYSVCRAKYHMGINF